MPIILSSDPDCPVLDNGLVRVRYDPGTGFSGGTGIPGFRVDVWNGSAYVEQGKMIFYRRNPGGFDDTWVAAGIHTDMGYTPDRAVVSCVLSVSTDPLSGERIYITLQRGEPGVTFECYPAPGAGATPSIVDVIMSWQPALNSGVADLNCSAVVINGQGSGSWIPSPPASTQNSGPTPGIITASAGTGSGLGKSGRMATVNPIISDFHTAENWVSILRCPTTYNVIGPYQVTLVTQQAANSSPCSLPQATGYGVSNNLIAIQSQNGAGYCQCQVFFSPTQAQQIMECESMALGAGTTTGSDSSASGATTTLASRSSDANAHVTQASWPNSFIGTYRTFARVKTTAAQASFYAKTGATTGTTVTATGAATPVYHWIDLGEIVANGTFELHAWISSGSGVVECDRIEAALVQDRVRAGATYSGSRDIGQAALQDSRTTGCLVAR